MVSFWKVGVAAFVLSEQTESMLAFTATRNGGRTAVKNLWVPPHQTKNVWRRQMASTAGTTEEAKAAESKEGDEDAYSKVSMEDIVSLCKRRGFIFPSSEIYNGFAGFYDYGPLGCELKKNVKDTWWKNFVTRREDVVGLDSSIIHNPTTWKSSGTYLFHFPSNPITTVTQFTHVLFLYFLFRNSALHFMLIF